MGKIPANRCDSKFSEADVAIFALHHYAGMDLETEGSGAGEFGVRVFGGFLAVDPAGEGVALGPDAEGIPLAFGLHEFLGVFRLADFGVGGFAAGVKRARHVHAQAAGNAELELDFRAAHFQAGVDAAVGGGFPAHIKFDHEIAVRFFGPEVITFFLGVVFADKDAVFGAPKSGGRGGFKMREVFAVEERRELGFGGAGRAGKTEGES